MSEHYYHQCCQHINRAVEITCHDGTVHQGIVHSVDRENVYLRSFDGYGGRDDGFGGPGLFAYGLGGGAFAGAFAGGLLGVGLGSILAFRPYGGFGGYGGYGGIGGGFY